MIVGLAIGGIVIGSILDDYSDYSNYSNHSDYSDAAYRRQMRLREKEREVDFAKQTLEDYKEDTINNYLQNGTLIYAKAQNVADDKLDDDAKRKIQKEIDGRANKRTEQYKRELEEIELLIEAIDEKL